MKPTAEQTKELSDMVQRLRADIPILVNTTVPPEHRSVTLRMMMAMVPPMYASMALERMHGTSPSNAQQGAVYALAIGMSGIISMTTSSEKCAMAAASIIEALNEMLQRWAAAGEMPISKPH